MNVLGSSQNTSYVFSLGYGLNIKFVSALLCD
jgi:hypothetical protein